MKKQIVLILGMASLAVLLSACGETSSNAGDEAPADSSEMSTGGEVGESASSEEIQPTGVQGDMKILEALCQESPGENVVYSPISLNTAIATYGELLEDGDAEAKAAVKAYLEDREYLQYEYGNPEVYRSVNVIWADSGYEKLNFDGVDPNLEVRWLDMSDPGATAIKNQFVSEATEGFIDSTPVEFTPETVMDIMNVLYFHDHWQGGELEELYDGTGFANSDGSVTNLDHMIGKVFSEGYYLKGECSTALSLEYENGMTFWVVLPQAQEMDFDALGRDVEGYLKGGTEFVVDRAESGALLEVYLEFPEFETTYNTKFENTGIPGLISYPISQKICPYETKNEINQIAKIKVDREGTTAAAVTEITMKNTAVAEPVMIEPYYFICDRPFLYLIYDGTNGDIAFMGVVNKASQGSGNTESTSEQSGISDEDALAAIENYCHVQNPDLKADMESGNYTIYWEIESSTEQQVVVLYRSYTAAEVRYYIDRSTGETYVTEFVQGITPAEERTEESFNAKDYIYKVTN